MVRSNILGVERGEARVGGRQWREKGCENVLVVIPINGVCSVEVVSVGSGQQVTQEV